MCISERPCVFVFVSTALHVCVCDVINSQHHSIPPAIINSDVQPNVIMYGPLHDLLSEILLNGLRNKTCRVFDVQDSARGREVNTRSVMSVNEV